ncbi:MAG: hypothetical protein JXB49_33780 [Bacteroidales bacterium]|nr:hypothetical protein [Bacteroidales bacterium]
MEHEAVYLDTYKKGLLDKKIANLYERMKNCDICPRKCSINRFESDKGICRTGTDAIVASHHPHFGEEEPLVDGQGSGTIFFSYCNLLCAFCQNYDISHEGTGKKTTTDELAGMMLELQEMGCHNINLVTPTHVIPMVLKSLKTAIEGGLKIPLVYNSSAYDSVETLKELEGIIDIYMPDFKFWEPEISFITCKVCDYPAAARNAIKEMHRQVGDLQINKQGLAYKGMIIRHLVLPNILTDTEKILDFIQKEISKKSYINIMPQYYPAGEADKIDKISRRLLKAEFDEAIHLALRRGLTRLDNRKFNYF